MGNVAVRNPRKIYSQYNDAGAIAILSNNVYKVTYYEIITGASGTLTLPSGATINAGEFSGANCILSEIDGNNKPTYVTPLDGGGSPVTATLNVGTGAWVKSAATVSVNVALIYSLNIAAINYQNLNNFYIIEDVLLAQITIGTTTITSGTNTRILYNNNGVVGEYTVTGTGTTAVLSNSPTLITPNIGAAIGTSLIVGGGTNIGFDLAAIKATNVVIGAKTTLATGTCQFFLQADNSSRSFSVYQTGSTYPASGIYEENSSWIYCFSKSLLINNALSGGTIVFASGGTTMSGMFSSTGNFGLGVTPTVKFHLGASAGANGGMLVDLLANHASATSSYSSIDFKVPTTGLMGQFFATASNYANAGVNLAANSLGLIAEATSGQLALGAGGSGGYTTITCGGYAAANEGFRVDANLNVTIGNAALATNATNGFLYVTSCAGTPTGVPTAKTGRIPIVVDSTNNRMYIYSGGAWVALN